MAGFPRNRQITTQITDREVVGILPTFFPNTDPSSVDERVLDLVVDPSVLGASFRYDPTVATFPEKSRRAG